MEQQNILVDNGKYFFYNELSIEKQLPPGVYKLNTSSQVICLEKTTDFLLPDKIYDVDQELRQMIITEFQTNKTNTGALFIGNKGQGKTVTAKQITKQLGIPVITITDKIPIEADFISFFKKITQDYIIFLDEFEKNFDKLPTDNSDNKDYHTQKSFLSFMDGAGTNGTNKILFLITTNDDINEYFINRPSRIKFRKEYNEMEESLFKLITDDLLENKDFLKDLEENTSLLNLNIDLLVNIIKDINLFKKPFSKFSHLYNYTLEEYKYEVYIKEPDKKEEFIKSITNYTKFKNDDSYIAGYNVENIIKCTREEIIFEAQNGNPDGGKCTVRLIPYNIFKFKSIQLTS